MVKKELMVIIDEGSPLTSITLSELCEVYQIPADYIRHLVDYEIIQPVAKQSVEWVFEVTEVQRIKSVMRLQHDLDFNLVGAAIVLDLLEELQEMRARMALLEKHHL